MQEIILFLKDLSLRFSFIPDIVFYMYCAVFVIAVVICNLSLFFSFNGRSGPAFTELLFSSGIACGALPAGIYYINDKFIHFDKWAVIIVIFMIFPIYNIIMPIKTLLNMNKIPLHPENQDISSRNENIENIVKDIFSLSYEDGSLDEDIVKDNTISKKDKIDITDEVTKTDDSKKENKEMKEKEEIKKFSKNMVTPKKRLLKRHRKL